ncbi:TrbM/KikA/MpfK family conjugal transfer protein [Limnohabitans radicicola]|uniref:Conjugal transfer protein TrbM n=1 Tax=Limnohabitans radicicola TaxID=2771427 RepID=A0A927IME3_9BURK|nr:TrbM/KikA/MpfK family conjugal transfer protein [Limnohabitans radicicola]MBD8051095.1 conjugal transfer protein TrbM [Limnohabitans radicicola]
MFRKSLIIWTLGVTVLIPPAQAQAALDGDEKLACEALLCLAASTRPAECVPSIRKYFSISFRLFKDTLRGRLNFLNLCPVVTLPHMQSFKNALVNGAGRCDAASINQANYQGDMDSGFRVENVMPSYCVAYFGNGLVQSGAPVYVGEPQFGGHWVEAKDYAVALQEYTAMRARQAAQAVSADQP